MKVNKIPVFTIVSHKNICVEKLLKGLEPLQSVPVYKDFNYEALIGVAHLRVKRGSIYADIHLLANIKGYPAIAYRNTDGVIYALGISTKPNIDPDIETL